MKTERVREYLSSNEGTSVGAEKGWETRRSATGMTADEHRQQAEHWSRRSQEAGTNQEKATNAEVASRHAEFASAVAGKDANPISNQNAIAAQDAAGRAHDALSKGSEYHANAARGHYEKAAYHSIKKDRNADTYNGWKDRDAAAQHKSAYEHPHLYEDSDKGTKEQPVSLDQKFKDIRTKAYDRDEKYSDTKGGIDTGSAIVHHVAAAGAGLVMIAGAVLATKKEKEKNEK